MRLIFLLFMVIHNSWFQKHSEWLISQSKLQPSKQDKPGIRLRNDLMFADRRREILKGKPIADLQEEFPTLFSADEVCLSVDTNSYQWWLTGSSRNLGLLLVLSEWNKFLYHMTVLMVMVFTEIVSDGVLFTITFELVSHWKQFSYIRWNSFKIKIYVKILI